MRRRKEAALAILEDERVDAEIEVARIREQTRLFEGIDHVRGF
jgi:hypothetical protein